MRKTAILLCLLLLFAAAGRAETAELTDVLGNTVVLPENPRVVSCHASFAQCWLLSGGELVGVTEDALEDRGMQFSDEIGVVGTVKSVDLERLLALDPDYVILSADLTAHRELQSALDQMGLAYGYYREDAFEDYAAVMKQFCAVNDPSGELYRQNVEEVQSRIRSVMTVVLEETDRSFLLLRAFSTGMKAKTDDNLAGQILKEYGLRNIADDAPSLLEDLSMERIMLDDPDYIFVVTMGDEQAAKDYLQRTVSEDPVWQGLSAVKNGRYVILPQDLFHYKPNARWDESYRYLAQILYPKIFAEVE